MRSLPNILTTVRVFIAAVFLSLPSDWQVTALAIALLTEFLDGQIARRYHAETFFGRMYDPVADRCLAFSVGLTLVFSMQLTSGQLTSILARDLVVISGIAISVMMGESEILMRFRPNFFGKLTTVLQYAVFFSVLLGFECLHTIIALACAASFISAIIYMRNFIVLLSLRGT